MQTQTKRNGNRQPVVQLSVFTPNRLGRFNELIGLLSAHGVSALAVMVLDTTESAIVRMVVDDPDEARELLSKESFAFTETSLVVVEVTADQLPHLVTVLVQAELNINYLYSFIPHPHGRSILALNLDDNEMAERALGAHQFRLLRQGDLVR